MNEDIRKAMLSSIASGGSVNIAVRVADSSKVVDLGSGKPRIKPHLTEKFDLILNSPLPLNPLEIRCCLCHRVISYPAWHYVVSYDVNEFHHFVCFDSNSPEKVNTRCMR